jgi:hypothetical protein
MRLLVIFLFKVASGSSSLAISLSESECYIFLRWDILDAVISAAVAKLKASTAN